MGDSVTAAEEFVAGTAAEIVDLLAVVADQFVVVAVAVDIFGVAADQSADVVASWILVSQPCQVARIK